MSKTGMTLFRKSEYTFEHRVGKELKNLFRFCQILFLFFLCSFRLCFFSFSFAALFPISFCLKRKLVKSNSAARCPGALGFCVGPGGGADSFGSIEDRLSCTVAGMLVEGVAFGFWVVPGGSFGRLEEPEDSFSFLHPPHYQRKQ